MEIQRKFIHGNGFQVPAVLLMPYSPAGAAVIVHGYGGSKEEQLGLAWRVAEMGFAACAIDLRGHGEHSLPFGLDAAQDVEAAIQFCRAFGKVGVVGHSLGGRLGLLSTADQVIAISPAFCKTYTQITRDSMRKRHYRVRQATTDTVYEICEMLPVWEPDGRPVALIYGSRDIPEIARACEEQKAKGVSVTCIENGLHSETYLLEATFETVRQSLEKLTSE